MAAPTLVVAKGNILRTVFQCKSLGSFIDPTTVTCKYALTSSPGSPASATPVKDSAGCYHADIDTTSLTVGVYTLTWKGTGTAIALIERQVSVVAAVIP